MAFGSPVCDICYQTMKFSDDKKEWRCPQCGQHHFSALRSLGEISKDEPKKYED